MTRRTLAILLGTTALLRFSPEVRSAMASHWWDGGVTPVQLGAHDVTDAWQRIRYRGDRQAHAADTLERNFEMFDTPQGRYFLAIQHKNPFYDENWRPLIKGAT